MFHPETPRSMPGLPLGPCNLPNAPMASKRAGLPGWFALLDKTSATLSPHNADQKH
jgi:hypothetical protein